MSANLNWSCAANQAIVNPAASVQLKAFRTNSKGERKEATDAKAAELLDLLANPNNMHTWEQLAQLHYSYMNFVGERYTMMFKAGQPWAPVAGQLPDALQEIPASQVDFRLDKTGYSKSIVRFNNTESPLGAFVRDLNPDPNNPVRGLSIIAASSVILNSDQEMRTWNNNLMANGANPSVVLTSNEPLDDNDSYERWKQQFQDEYTGSANSGKPLLIEDGDVKPFMLSPRDLNFLESRKFTRDEILAMWRVNPYMIGSVENVNLATATAARIQHAEINIEPRVRQWVKQMNATFVQVFDPGLELGYDDDIVPTDEAAKLAEFTALSNKVYTIDEARAEYGLPPLDDDLGAQLYLPNTNAPLSSIADGSAKPEPPQMAPAPKTPDDDEEGGTNDPGKDGKKSLARVKKET